jgi:hypothetical protein
VWPPIRPKTVKFTKDKYGREQTENFLKGCNFSETLEAFTEKQARTILRFPSIDILRDEAARRGYSPSPERSGRQVQRPEVNKGRGIFVCENRGLLQNIN